MEVPLHMSENKAILFIFTFIFFLNIVFDCCHFKDCTELFSVVTNNLYTEVEKTGSCCSTANHDSSEPESSQQCQCTSDETYYVPSNQDVNKSNLHKIFCSKFNQTSPGISLFFRNSHQHYIPSLSPPGTRLNIINCTFLI